MFAPLQAVIGDIRTSLGTVPLYTQWSRVNRDADPPPNGINLIPPYAVFAPVIRAAKPNSFDKAIDVGLDILAPAPQIGTLTDSVGWLDDYVIPFYGDSEYIRYSFRSGPVFREPDVFMPDGRTEVWHYSGLYRATYTLVTSVGGIA